MKNKCDFCIVACGNKWCYTKEERFKMQIKYIKEKGIFMHNNKQISMRDIRDAVMADKYVAVIDDEEYDMTKEVMVKLAFGKHLPLKTEGEPTLLYALEKLIDEDILHDIISSGGIENYLIRTANRRSA